MVAAVQLLEGAQVALADPGHQARVVVRGGAPRRPAHIA
jgi:hypothetical protein